ncbi:hypothetical protein K491DRAFT_518070 [Lophiostoma macrostomum CBS 122681]|uniref:Uncharacterized protein n=1 Tax=Lophiostoma macrostomum CBS 122681 TaxID=1314788 RepID=A0A6A6T081_9PLEO|nr:hypothetical protein K491DRAFT_518070 [Lophiostoma macrostomum CBS 122681]
MFASRRPPINPARITSSILRTIHPRPTLHRLKINNDQPAHVQPRLGSQRASFWSSGTSNQGGSSSSSGQGQWQGFQATPAVTPPQLDSKIILFHHSDDTKQERDLRDEIPWNMTPQEMLDLAADIEMRIAHVYNSIQRPSQGGVAALRKLVALLRKFAKTAHTAPEEYWALMYGLRHAAAAYHATTIQGWVVTEDEAAKLFRLYRILYDWNCLLAANVLLKNLNTQSAHAGGKPTTPSTPYLLAALKPYGTPPIRRTLASA